MNNMEKILVLKDKLFSYAAINKYTFTVLVFVVWLAFFDKYSFAIQYQLSQNVKELESQKADYEEQLADALIERKTINSDIEKYGREKYLFHKEGEEIIGLL